MLQHVPPPHDTDTFMLILASIRCNLHHETHVLICVSPRVSACVGPDVFALGDYSLRMRRNSFQVRFSTIALQARICFLSSTIRGCMCSNTLGAWACLLLILRLFLQLRLLSVDSYIQERQSSLLRLMFSFNFQPYIFSLNSNNSPGTDISKRSIMYLLGSTSTRTISSGKRRRLSSILIA
jgi:hypothetical protein